MSSTNLFKISNFIIQFKDARQLELMVTSANIPGITLGDLILNRSVVNDKRPGDSLTYDDLRITALCDETLKVYQEVYNFIMSGAEPFQGRLDVVNPVFDCTLFLTTNKNNIQHKINFYNCYYKGIGDVVLTSGSTEEEQFSFDITMGYSFFSFGDHAG